MNYGKTIVAAMLALTAIHAEPAEAAFCRGVKCVVASVVASYAKDKLLDTLAKIQERKRQRERLKRCLPPHDCRDAGKACPVPPSTTPCVFADAAESAPNDIRAA